MRLLFITLMLLYATGATSEYEQMHLLTGQWDISGYTAVDPPSDESRDTHFRVYLTGVAARSIYSRMNVEAEEDWCGAGLIGKSIGDVSCSFSSENNEYECWFAIDINKAQISGGWAC